MPEQKDHFQVARITLSAANFIKKVILVTQMFQKQPRFEGGKDRKTTLPWDMDAVIKREEINGALSFAEGPASKSYAKRKCTGRGICSNSCVGLTLNLAVPLSGRFCLG